MAMKTGKLGAGWHIVLILLPLVTGLVCLCMGRVPIPVGEVLGALTGAREVTQMNYMTVWNLRLPRILLAALAGAGLS